MIRPIVRYGHVALQQPARDVDGVTSETRALVEDMLETMYGAPGIGLAAPQIGVPLRAFVIDLSTGRDRDAVVVMINPAFVERHGIQLEEEGCLSVPGFTASVARPSRVVVRGLNRDGRMHEVEGTALMARALCHEMDHLDGRLFLDRLRAIRRAFILRRVRRLVKNGRW